MGEAGVGGRDTAALRGCWDFRRATAVWQLHYNMYLKALKISATVKPPLPQAAGVYWEPQVDPGWGRLACVLLRKPPIEGWPLGTQLSAWGGGCPVWLPT